MQDLIDLNLLIKNCTDCKLHKVRNNTVPGTGQTTLDIMMIGEGPGYYEDRDGTPFNGPSGRFLTELLKSIELTREDIFLTNVLKCRAPGNRDPQIDEILACSKYLDRQIELVNPWLIVTLGKYSTEKFIKFKKISDVRGRLYMVDGRYILPIMHPAAGLRNQKWVQSIKDDFKTIPDIMKLPRPKVTQTESQMNLL